MSPYPIGSSEPQYVKLGRPSLLLLLHGDDGQDQRQAAMIGDKVQQAEQTRLLLSQPQQQQQQIPMETLTLSTGSAHAASRRSHAWMKQPSRATKPKKQRCPSHVIKQEVKQQLCDQIRHLECQEALLRQEEGIVDPRVNDGALEHNARLREAVLHQHLILANTQSAFSAFTTSQATSPLASYIHLDEDWDQRRQVLLAMKDAKLDVAKRFLAERTRHLSPSKTFYEVSQFESAHGGICIVKTDVTPFEGAASVRQVYDALQSYFMSSDATIVELPGSISVRENDDESDMKTVLHHRLVTFEQSGILSEKNSVLFLDQSGLDAENPDDQCALFTGDFVDRDDLYPYCPSLHLRKDTTSVIKLSAHWRPDPETQTPGSAAEPCGAAMGSELVVVLTRWMHLRVRRPEIPVSRHTLQCVADNMLQGVDKMIQATKERVGGEWTQRRDDGFRYSVS